MARWKCLPTMLSSTAAQQHSSSSTAAAARSSSTAAAVQRHCEAGCKANIGLHACLPVERGVCKEQVAGALTGGLAEAGAVHKPAAAACGEVPASVEAMEGREQGQHCWGTQLYKRKSPSRCQGRYTAPHAGGSQAPVHWHTHLRGWPCRNQSSCQVAASPSSSSACSFRDMYLQQEWGGGGRCGGGAGVLH